MISKDFLNLKKKHIIDLKSLLDAYSKNKEKIMKLSSGSGNLDEILGGGLHTGNIYLIFGASKTGKTQFCHQMCVQSIKNKKAVYYLDLENTFRAERISQLGTYRGLNPDIILKDILVSKIMSNSMLLLSLKSIERNIIENKPFLLIVDTINNYFRRDQGDLNISFQKARDIFLRALQMLSIITIRHDIITILTAQIRSNFLQDPIIRESPVGNQYLNHYISEYLYLRRVNNEINSAHIINSQYLPEKKSYYKIAPAGLVDP